MKLSVTLVKIVFKLEKSVHFLLILSLMSFSQGMVFALDFLLGVYSFTWSVQRAKIVHTPWRVSVISQEFLCSFSFCYRKWADLRRICRKLTVINYDMGNMEAVG